MGRAKAMNSLLIIGECGVGKTWVCANAVKELKLKKKAQIGKIKFHHNDAIILAGVYDGSVFQGTDRLSMSIMSDIDLFLNYTEGKTLIAEGDRFTNSTFIKKANPTIFRILGDGLEGRKKRGTKQSERQIKSIATRVNNISSSYKDIINVDNSNDCLSEIISYVRMNRGVK
tara:strand:- start:22620 stop:23135 length:516 start_codon:yes stop_codon:yes gene_type:complete